MLSDHAQMQAEKLALGGAMGKWLGPADAAWERNLGRNSGMPQGCQETHENLFTFSLPI